MNLFFKIKGFQSGGFLNFTPREAYSEAMEGAIIVDVRETHLTGYKKFDVPNVIYIPNSVIELRYKELPRDKGLIIADSVGLRSREVMQFLLSKGFTNIANLASGIVGWEQDGLPLIIDKNEQLSGSCVCQLRRRKRN